MKKQLGWACKLGGAEPLAISKAGHTVLARLMMSLTWHDLTSAVGGEFSKGTMASAHLDANTSVSPCIPLEPFMLLPWFQTSEGVSLSPYGYFKRNCLGIQDFLPLTQYPLVFTARSCGNLPS